MSPISSILLLPNTYNISGHRKYWFLPVSIQVQFYPLHPSLTSAGGSANTLSSGFTGAGLTTLLAIETDDVAIVTAEVAAAAAAAEVAAAVAVVAAAVVTVAVFVAVVADVVAGLLAVEVLGLLSLTSALPVFGLSFSTGTHSALNGSTGVQSSSLARCWEPLDTGNSRRS